MTLEEACNQYYNRVYRYCWYNLFKNDSAAEEATQETFAALCRDWYKLDHNNFEPWLMSTAWNYINKEKAHYTKNKNLVSIEGQEYIDPATEVDPHEQAVRDKVDRNIEELVGKVNSQLDDKERFLAESLRNHKKHAEIAEEIGSKPGAVSMAASRLRKKVKGIVKKIVEEIP